jgi:hypothetical protein
VVSLFRGIALGRPLTPAIRRVFTLHRSLGKATFTQDIATEVLPVLPISNPQETYPALASAAKLTTCQAKKTAIDVCIDSGMTIFSQEMTSIPPDPHGAVGPSTLIAVTNTQIESLYKANGLPVFGPTPLEDMLSSLYPYQLYDPKIIYDVHRSRFVLVVLDRLQDGFDVFVSRIILAVSKTSAPMSTTSRDWYFHEIDGLVDGLYADYPGIAVDEEAIYITCNMFQAFSPGWFMNSLLWIVAKNPFYTGGVPAVSLHDYIVEANDGFWGTHMPAMVRSSTGIAPNVGTYLIKYDGLGTSDGTEFLSIIQVDSPLSNPTFRQEWIPLGDIEVDASMELADAPQWDPYGRGALIEVNDRRSLDAVWVNNQLWVVTTGLDPSGETAALWIKLNANGVDFPPTLADYGYITGEDIGAGTSTFFASLDVNSKGVAAFGFSASSGGIYPSAYAAIRDDVKDPAGKVRLPMLVKAGEAPYNVTFGGERNSGATTAAWRWIRRTRLVSGPSTNTPGVTPSLGMTGSLGAGRRRGRACATPGRCRSPRARI